MTSSVGTSRGPSGRPAGGVEARLARIEAMLGRLEDTMTQAQLAGATVVDAVDDIARRQGDELQLPDRAERLVSVLEVFTRPKNLEALEQLGTSVSALGAMGPMLAELPNVAATAVDVVDDIARNNPDLAVAERAQSLVALLETATRPQHLEALNELAQLFSRIAPVLPLLARLTEPALLTRLERTLDAAEKLGPALDSALDADAGRAGLWDLWRAMKDPDVQRAVYRGLVLARAVGKQDKLLKGGSK